MRVSLSACNCGEGGCVSTTLNVLSVTIGPNGAVTIVPRDSQPEEYDRHDYEWINITDET